MLFFPPRILTQRREIAAQVSFRTLTLLAACIVTLVTIAVESLVSVVFKIS